MTGPAATSTVTPTTSSSTSLQPPFLEACQSLDDVADDTCRDDSRSVHDGPVLAAPAATDFASATEVAPQCVVDLVPSTDGDDQYQQHALVDLIADPVVAHPDPPDAGVALEWFAAGRAQGLAEPLDGLLDRFGIGGLLLAQLVQELVSGPQDLN